MVFVGQSEGILHIIFQSKAGAKELECTYRENEINSYSKFLQNRLRGIKNESEAFGFLRSQENQGTISVINPPWKTKNEPYAISDEEREQISTGFKNLSATFRKKESYETSEKQYYAILGSYYNDPSFIAKIKAGDSYAKTYEPNLKQHIEITESGNTIFNYLSNANLVLIVGLVSKTGKIKREEVSEINEWFDRLYDEVIDDDKTLITSPNDFSLPLIERLIKRGESEGYTFDKQLSDTLLQHSGVSWRHLTIRKEE